MGITIDGARALITGASRGIGLAIAEQLGRRGVRLALSARDETRLAAAATHLRALGATVDAVFAADLGDEAGPERLLAGLREAGLVPDLLVNNAGLYRTGWMQESDPLDWDAMWRLNVRAPMRLVHGLLPAWIAARRGAVVQIGSVAGLEGFPRHAGYAASKFALRGFTQALFAEVRRYDILVTHICPGYVETDLVEGVERVDRSHMLRAEDVASAVVWALETGPQACPTEIVLSTQRDVFAKA